MHKKKLFYIALGAVVDSCFLSSRNRSKHPVDGWEGWQFSSETLGWNHEQKIDTFPTNCWWWQMKDLELVAKRSGCCSLETYLARDLLMGWHDLQRDLKKSRLQHLPPCLHPQTCWVPSTDSWILLCVLLIAMVATALMRDVFVVRMCDEMSFLFLCFF